MSVTKEEIKAGRERFDQAIERQERLDAWAGMAMQGLLANDEEVIGDGTAAGVAELSYDLAEALEAERARRLGR